MDLAVREKERGKNQEETMSAILAVIGSKIGAIGLGAALPLAFILVNKMLPRYVGGLFANLLGKGTANLEAISDPIRKQLIHNIAFDLVKLAEYEVPGEGQGKVKFEMVANKLCAIIPFLKGQEDHIVQIIESSVVAMDDELHKAGNNLQ